MRPPVILSIAATAVLLAGASPAVWAQPYRTVGPDGRVTYSDMPPTATSAGNAANRSQPGNSGSRNGGGSPTAGLPYALAQVVQQYPVTLYTSQGCVPCNAGRNLLVNRGIPFTEKTVDSNDDIAALKKIAGDANVPLLTIGTQQLSGFQDSNWSQYLSAAGYPPTSQLPGSYHRPPATPLTAPKAVAPATAPQTSPAPANPANDTPVTPAPDPNNPAGIRF